MENYIWFAIALFTLGWTSTQAEPTPSIQYLMREPATLFDLGIMRLEKTLQDRGTVFCLSCKDTISVKIDEVKVEYDWDKNRIKLKAGSPDFRKARKPDTAKTLCRNVLKSLRITTITLVPIVFSHYGYKRTNEPKDLLTELGNIIEISVSGSYMTEKRKDKELDLKTVECTGMLMSNDIFFKEQK